MKYKFAMLFLLVLVASAASSPAKAATEVTFGVTSATAFNLAHYVATEKKYYEAQGLKVDMIVAGAAVGVLQQLAAGSLKFAQAATDQTLRAILRGAPIKIVAGAASNAPFRVVAAKHVKGWSDRHALRSSSEHAAFEEMVLAQGLGDADRQAPRDEKGDRGAGTSVGRDHAPHLG